MMPSRDQKKPAHILALEKAYGPPSQEAFGSAVFFRAESEHADLEALAKEYYQFFVGDLWDEWGSEAWLSPWRETYRRPEGARHQIEQELRGIEDADTRNQVGMILDVIHNAEPARQALAGAYDAPDVTALQAYLIGDGEAMLGLLLVGQRENGEVTILVFLYD